MNKYFAFLFFLLSAGLPNTLQALEEKNLQPVWMIFKDGEYKIVDNNAAIKNTIYFTVETSPFPTGKLFISSSKLFFVFFNGKLSGSYKGNVLFDLDSLSAAHATSRVVVAIHQKEIIVRDLKTSIIISQKNSPKAEDISRPSTYFKDFVIIAGLIIIVLFVFISRLNPKLAGDYLSVIRIFSLREADDAQASARLTSKSNVQFYIISSLLLGFCMVILVQYLPAQYALSSYFIADSFWMALWHWIKLSFIIFLFFFAKIMLVYAFTRLFDMKGLARIHFFNWMRLMLVVFGTASVILFSYFIMRGQSAAFFAAFLILIAGTLTVWIFLAFLKLKNKSEHSMFHLFSYICATEIIPLLITIKVLFH